MKFIYEIDENEVLDMIQDSCGPGVTMKMVKEIIMTDESVVMNMIQWGISETSSRESCADALSKKLTGMCWPCNGDSDTIKADHDAKWNEAMKNG